MEKEICSYFIFKLLLSTYREVMDFLHLPLSDHFMKVKVAQLCLTLCIPMDWSLPAPLSMKFSRKEYWSG